MCLCVLFEMYFDVCGFVVAVCVCVCFGVLCLFSVFVMEFYGLVVVV